MNQNTLDQLASKRKFVAVFVSIAVVGVILISIAVYKASKELEIVDEIDNMYRLTASRIYSDTAHPDERLSELIKMLTPDETGMQSDYPRGEFTEYDLDEKSHVIGPFEPSMSDWKKVASGEMSDGYWITVPGAGSKLLVDIVICPNATELITIETVNTSVSVLNMVASNYRIFQLLISSECPYEQNRSGWISTGQVAMCNHEKHFASLRCEYQSAHVSIAVKQ